MTTNLCIQRHGGMKSVRVNPLRFSARDSSTYPRLSESDALGDIFLRHRPSVNLTKHLGEINSNIFHEYNHNSTNDLTQDKYEQAHLLTTTVTSKIMSMDILIKTVRNLMEQKQVSQEEFTAAIKMSQSWCSRFLSGEIKDPRRKTVEKIADFFEVTYEYLTTGEMTDSQGRHVTSVNALILINRIIALDSKGLLNQSLYNALSTTLDLVSANHDEEQVISEEHKGPRSAGPDLTPDGRVIMEGDNDKLSNLIAEQNARTNKKTG